MIAKKRCYETKSFDETSEFCNRCGYYRSCRNNTLGKRYKCFKDCEHGKHAECLDCPAKFECKRKAEEMEKEKHQNPSYDPVNHPSHYTQNKFESIDEMMIAFGPEAVYHFCICNAWKYKNRAPFKGNFEEDMKKADWYLNKAKEIKGGELMARITKDEYYLGIALAVSKRSTCIKRHYGCVIVKDDIIIATGYNGSPRGEENCCDRGTCKRANAERYSNYESCDSVHAEQNALIATSRERLIGATVYLACEEYGLNEEKSAMWEEEIIDFHEDKNPVPCGICSRMLKNAGIVRVVNRSGDVCL